MSGRITKGTCAYSSPTRAPSKCDFHPGRHLVGRPCAVECQGHEVPASSSRGWRVSARAAASRKCRSLTAAPIDLLPPPSRPYAPYRDRVSTSLPRRGRGGAWKTIEIALLLRELASRGELNRALMVVPAGLETIGTANSTRSSTSTLRCSGVRVTSPTGSRTPSPSTISSSPASTP